MEIRYMILARYAEYSPDGKLTLIGGDIEKYVWDEFPVVQPILFAATRLVLNREDTRTSHRFKSMIQNADGETIADGVEGTIHDLEMPPDMTELGACMILSFAGVVYPKPGWYKMVLSIDDEVAKEVRYRVMARDEEKALEAAVMKAYQEKDDGRHIDNDDQ